jgi:hypothetical protein
MIFRMFIRLFYSTQCTESMNLWQVIRNEGIERMFIPICLDDFNSKQISQLSIKEIPAIVISAESQPPAVYEGPQMCSQWLNTFTMNRRQNMLAQIDAQRRLIQKTQAIARTQANTALEYTATEMEGVSDDYAYNNTDLSQPKNFVMIGHEDKCQIMTPQAVEGKVNSDMMRKQISEIESARNNDTQQFMQAMEQSQINAVMSGMSY